MTDKNFAINNFVCLLMMILIVIITFCLMRITQSASTSKKLFVIYINMLRHLLISTDFQTRA